MRPEHGTTSGAGCLRIARIHTRAALIDCAKFALRNTRFAVLGALAFLCSNLEPLRAQFPDVAKASHADALAFCGGSVTRPFALRDDKKVLCFDGLLFHEADVEPALDLEPGGYFVVRGLGGDVGAMMKLADAIGARRATVVVRDYCLAACASYLLIASVEAVVPKNALVAWNNLRIGSNDCFRFLETKDRGAPRFVADDCKSSLHPPFGDPLFERKASFYARRLLVRPFEEAPASVAVRRALKRKFDETGRYPREMFWTWNPRYYASVLRTKVNHEAYPQSQAEVDALRERLQLQYPVIYDP